jgi:hypothetical protein
LDANDQSDGDESPEQRQSLFGAQLVLEEGVHLRRRRRRRRRGTGRLGMLYQRYCAALCIKYEFFSFGYARTGMEATWAAS